MSSIQLPLGRSLKCPKVIGESGSLGKLEWKKSNCSLKYLAFANFKEHKPCEHMAGTLGSISLVIYLLLDQNSGKCCFYRNRICGVFLCGQEAGDGIREDFIPDSF